MRKLTYLVLSLLFFVSCKENNETLAGQIEIPGENATSLQFGSEGGTLTFSFNSSLNWTASTTADWLTLSATNGPSGEASFEVTATASDVHRDGVIVIESGTTVMEVTVDQSKYPAQGTFKVKQTELTLEKYENEKFIWHLILRDEEHYDSQGRLGNCVYIKLFLDKTWNYSKGIPFGEFIIADSQEVGTALGAYTQGYEEQMIKSGSVELIKAESGLKIGLLIKTEDATALSTYYTVDTEYSYMNNNAYNSTIGEDLNITNFPQAYADDLGDIYMVGKKLWDIYIAQSGIQFKYVGIHQGEGEILTISLVTPLDATTPVGKYNFVMDDYDLIDYTALGGYRSWINGMGINSWWKRQTGPNSFTDEAPFVAGSVEVKQNPDGTYTVDVLGVDDALPESNSLIVKYSGPLDIFDRNKTGDYSVANMDFYGPFEFPSENMNWFIGLGDKEFHETKGRKGSAWVFDIMSTPEQTFSKGLPYGKYTIGSNTGYAAGTCHMAYQRIYNEYQLVEEIKIVRGTVEIKLLADGREQLIVDVTDEKGNKHTGEYCGIIARNSVSIPPYADRVFNGANASVKASFYGTNYAPENESPAKQEWDIVMEDAELLDSKGESGLGITLMLRTSKPTSFEDGLPVGVFKLYEPDQDGVIEGIYNGDYTYYSVRYETAESKVMITGGSVIVSKNNDEYTIELQLETGNKEVMYTVTGGYTGKLEMADFSSTRRDASRSITRKSTKATPELSFKK